MKTKEIIMNWLFKDITLDALHTKSIYIIGGKTAYINLLDMDHKTSDPSATESQMWYNSTDHVMRYRNNTETVDF